ncbi:hypothetical protein ACF1AJ_17770 [Leifsonia sp. NPDC014704]|uniref:hypothetical protein n=1 Tax=Leifsonia sp. NPDC014704 TaxID=3364123 RepID=UPI0036F46622
MTDATEATLPDAAEPLGPPPKQVAAAFWVFLGIVAVRLILLPFTIVRQWSVNERVIESGRTKYGQAVAEQSAGLIHGASITGQLIVVALFALCLLAAFRLRRGAAWARVVATILGAVSVVTAALDWRSPIALTLGVAGIAGIVLLWVRPSNAWFRAARETRRAEAQRRADAEASVNGAS